MKIAEMFSLEICVLKFVFSKKATKIDEIFNVDLKLATLCQIGGEDFFNFFAFLYEFPYK